MREILFRAKRKDNSEWIFGSIVHQTDYYGDKCDRWFILEGNYTNDYDIDYPIEVQKETVGQFTGLTDKNGKRIFEGDIVRFKDDVYRVSDIGKVVFNKGAFCIEYDSYGRTRYHRIGQTAHWQEMQASGEMHYTYEAIGNIHDNPELLEGGGEDG